MRILPLSKHMGMAMAAQIFPDSECEHCGSDLISPNIEAWELTGALICDECAEAAFEAISEGIE